MGTLALTRALRAAISLITMTLTVGVLVAVEPSAPAVAADPAPPCSTKAVDDGDPYTVPAGVTTVRITAYGEAGEAGLSVSEPFRRDAGPGAKVTADIAVSPGDVLRPIRIDGGGWGRGGNAELQWEYSRQRYGFSGTRGGAARGVVRVADGCREPLVVAGGGGGNGAYGSTSRGVSDELSYGRGMDSTGGAAGLGPSQPGGYGQAGGNGRNDQEDGAGGAPGTLSAGGAGGAGGRDSWNACPDGQRGGAGAFETAGGGAQGNDQGDCDPRGGGGGGGGGYYGGGGGGSNQSAGSGAGAGGGGSSYVVAGASNVSYVASEATRPPAPTIEPVYAPAGAPTTVTAVPHNTRADVTFTPPASPYEIGSYTVTAIPGGRTTSVTPGTGALTGTVTGLTNDTSYRFTVTAVPAVGVLIEGSPAVSPQSNPVIPVLEVPSAVRNLTASPGDGTVRLTWDPPADDGGASITDYYITWPSGSGHRGQAATGTSATIDQGLTNGQTKEFTVVARNSVGDGAPATAMTMPRAVAKPVKQPAPTGVPGNGYVDLEFTPAEPGYDQFTVTVSPEPSFGGTRQTFDANYSYGRPIGIRVNQLTNGTAYRFTVAARNDEGNGPASDLSAPITPGLTAPTELRATVRRAVDALEVDLGHVIDGGSPVTSVSAYAVRWGGVRTDTVTVPLATPGVLPDHITIPGVTGELHQVFVSATNAEGTMADQSVGWGRAYVTPGQPTEVEASVPDDPDGGKVQVSFLTWQTGDCGTFEITAQPGGLTKTGTIPGGLECSGPQFHDVTFDGLSDDTTYTFTVQVTAPVAGAGPVSDASNPIRPYARSLPGRVTDLAAGKAGSGKVRLTFTPPPSVSWKYPVTEYRVMWDSGSTTVPAAEAAGGIVVGSLRNGVPYSFRVTARNAVGEGLATQSAQVTPAALETPTNLEAEGADEQVRLTFDEVENNGGGDLEYVVTVSDLNSSREVVTDSSPVLLTGLDNIREYWFTVRARNADGASAESEEVGVRPVSGLPGPPTNVTATSTRPEQATITWTAPEVDGGDAEITRYTVTAHPGGRQVEVEPDEVWGPVPTAATMTGLDNGTTYRFTVHANVSTCPGRCNGLESELSNPVTPDKLAQAAITLTPATAVYGSIAIASASGGSGSGSFGPITASGDACEIRGLTLVPLHATTADRTCTLSVTKGGDATYRSSTVEQVVAIARRPLTVTARDQRVTYGEAFPRAVDYGTFVNGEGPEDLGGTLTYGGTAVTSPGAGARTLLPGGLTSSDYELRFAAGTVTFDRAPAQIRIAPKVKTYGEANPTLTAQVTGTIGDDTLDYTLATTATTLSRPGAPYPIDATVSPDPNYDVTIVPADLGVLPAPLVIAADDVSAPFGEPPAFTATADGLVGSDTLADLQGTLDYRLENHTGSSAEIVPSGLSSPWYQIAWRPGTLTLTARASQITWSDPDPIRYGEELTADELDATASVPGTFLYSPALGSVLHAGTRRLTVEFVPLDPTHFQGATRTVDLEVAQAPLTVTTRPATKVYGQANPAFSVDHDGFVNGDDGGDLGGTLAFATSAGASSVVGDYGVTPSGLTSSDYDIDFEDGILSVMKAPLTVTALDASRAFGLANPAFAVDYDGFVLGQGAGVLGGALTYTTDADATSPVGDYDVMPGGLTSSNYAISFRPGILTVTKGAPGLAWADPDPITYGDGLAAAELDATASVPGTFLYSPALGTVLQAGTHELSVTFLPTDAATYESATTTVDVEVLPAPLAVTTRPATKVYGQANPAFSVDHDGFVNGDDADDLDGTLAFTTSADGSSPVGDYGVTPSGLTSSDYDIDFEAGTLTIEKAATSVTWDDPDPVVYGTALSATQLDATANVPGTFTYTPAAGTVLGGGVHDLTVAFTPADSETHRPTTTTVQLRVTRAPLTVTVVDASRVYGGAGPAFEVAYDGFLPGDGPGTLGGALAFATSAGPGSPMGTYPVTVSGLTSPDYEITYVAGSLRVTAASSSLRWDSPAPIRYGTALSATQLGATASMPGTYTYAPALGTVLRAGTHQLRVSFVPDNPSIGAVSGSVQLRVTKAPLTVTPADARRTFGEPNPSFDVGYDGFVNGDGPSSLGGTLRVRTDAVTSSGAGRYAIAVAGLSAADYDITYAAGTLTVAKAAVVLTGEPVVLPKTASRRRLVFSGSVVSAVTGDPLAGVAVIFALPRARRGTVGCTATTNAKGVATCRSGAVRKAVLGDRATYTMASAATTNLRAGSATGTVSRR